jgi:hypothetical protein
VSITEFLLSKLSFLFLYQQPLLNPMPDLSGENNHKKYTNKKEAEPQQ